MQYEFITDLSEEKYSELIKDSCYMHYKSDKLWNKLKNIDSMIYVGLKKKNKFIAHCKIEIICDNYIYFNVLNLFVSKDDEIVMALFINEIKKLAKEYGANKIIISDISTNNRLKKNTKNITQYSILKLQDKKKDYNIRYFKTIFNSDNTKILSTNSKLSKNDIADLQKIIEDWEIKLDFDINELLTVYKSKCSIILERLDLVYFLTKIKEFKNEYINVETIEELIDEYGENMIVGFSIILFPSNKNTAYCISFNTINSFNELNIKDNLILETISYTLKKKYNNLIFSSKIAHTDSLYEYKYEIVLNKFKNFILKLKSKKN